MYFFWRITLYLIEAHQANFFNNLPIETHFRIDSLPEYSPRDLHVEKQFHSMKGRLHELIHKQHIADFDLQPGFFDELSNKSCGGSFTKLSTTAGGTPERIGWADAPVANHQ